MASRRYSPEDNAVLEEFVTNSDAIENEFPPADSQQRQNHLRIAEVALQLPFAYLDPIPLRDMHRSLMAHDPEKFPGEFRQMNVYVGNERKMHPLDVREELPKLLDQARRGPDGITDDIDLWCWHMHHWFEHIHPFCDGNGRLGRLFLQALRANYGLPPTVIYASDRFRYYRSIETWEHDVERLKRDDVAGSLGTYECITMLLALEDQA